MLLPMTPLPANAAMLDTPTKSALATLFLAARLGPSTRMLLRPVCATKDFSERLLEALLC